MPFNLPFSVRISNTDPTDDRALTADAAAKNALIDAGRAYDGLLTYQQDVGKLYMLEDTATSGWTAMATENYVDTLISASGGTNINNPGDNRVLTSDGTTKGIDAESNLTFNGSTLTVTGTVAATTVTGANVTSGANPGHTHTTTSISGLDTGDITTGTLPVSRGGTGASTFTSNSVLTGNGTGALTAESNLTFDGLVLLVTGTVTATTVTGTNVTSGSNPGHTHTSASISALDAGDITTGTLLVSRGGTGLSTVGTNYMLTGNGTGALTAESNLTFDGSTLTVTGTVTATTFSGSLSGNATTATTLQTARTINGTSFNGSANITTANWGTSRTLTIGSTGKSVNGSGNVSWSLGEIGAPSTTGTGASGTWGISITGNAATATSVSVSQNTTSAGRPFIFTDSVTAGNKSLYTDSAATCYINPSTNTIGATTFIGALSGNASTASSAAQLTTARTINGTSFNGTANITTANWGTSRTLTIGSSGKSVNGSGNVSWSLSEIGAPSTTGTGASGTWGISITGNAATATSATSATSATNATNASNVYINDDDTGDTNCPIIFTQTTTAGNKPLYEDSSLYFDNTNNRLYSNWFYGDLSGNATTASTLQTARTINGTSFNGSANITTANWGTSRTLTIGSTGKAVNGSGNVSWTLSEIGAPSTTGTGASGTWGINITGSASYATTAGTISTTLPVSKGGTGLSTVGTNYILTGNGGGALTAEPNLTFSGTDLDITGNIEFQTGANRYLQLENTTSITADTLYIRGSNNIGYNQSTPSPVVRTGFIGGDVYIQAGDGTDLPTSPTGTWTYNYGGAGGDLYLQAGIGGTGYSSPSPTTASDGDVLISGLNITNTATYINLNATWVDVNQYIRHEAESSNYYEFNTGYQRSVINNGEIWRSTSSGLIVNENSSASCDFRVESDGYTHAFFIDATNSRILMGETSSASEAFKQVNIRYYDANSSQKVTGVGLVSDDFGLLISNDYTSICHASIDFSVDTVYSAGGYSAARFGFYGYDTTSTSYNYFYWTGGNSTTSNYETMRLTRDGNLHTRANMIAYSTTITSDERLKKNIENIDENILDKIMQLRPVKFEWKDESKRGEELVSGLIAQEVEKIFPELIYECTNLDDGPIPDETIYKHIRYNELIPYLTKSIQKQQEIINNQQQQLDYLKEKLNVK